MITDLAVSPDGSQLAYTALPGACGAGTGFKSPAAAAVSILDLSTGTVRTWQDTNTTGREMAGGLSWTPDGGTLIVNETSRGSSGRSLTVFGLNTAGSGGSLQADSTVLLKQNADCSRATCVTAVIAGPDHSLTAIESHAPGQKQTRVQVVSIPLAAGRPQTVLYSELTGRPAGLNDGMGLFADSSGQWVLLWPTGAQTGPQHAAGWISGGTLHPLPGVAQVFPQGIAW